MADPDDHPNTRSVLVSASLMCADPCNLEAAVRELEGVDVDLIHLDIMDGRFVPNMPMGLSVVEAVRARTTVPLDVHLMVENNDWFVDEVARMGARRVAIHVESAKHLDRSLARIRDYNMKAGVALNPATPLSRLEYVLDRIDFVLLMTVNPGFAGQKLVPSAFRKIAACRAFLEAHGVDLPIVVDGNVSFEHVPEMVAAGATILVAGTSSLYHQSGSLERNMERLRAAARHGLEESGGR